MVALVGQTMGGATGRMKCKLTRPVIGRVWKESNHYLYTLPSTSPALSLPLSPNYVFPHFVAIAQWSIF